MLTYKISPYVCWYTFDFVSSVHGTNFVHTHHVNNQLVASPNTFFKPCCYLGNCILYTRGNKIHSQPLWIIVKPIDKGFLSNCTKIVKEKDEFFEMSINSGVLFLYRETGNIIRYNEYHSYYL